MTGVLKGLHVYVGYDMNGRIPEGGKVAFQQSHKMKRDSTRTRAVKELIFQVTRRWVYAA